jgi:serine/threonine-protein kinase RsbW
VTAPGGKGQRARDAKLRVEASWPPPRTPSGRHRPVRCRLRQVHPRRTPKAMRGPASLGHAAGPYGRVRDQGETVMGTLIRRASDLHMSATFPGRPEEVCRVRAVLRPILEGCPAADEALLCASELATNALLHSDTREAGGTFTVRAEIRPRECVTIEVEDGGGCWAQPVPHPARGRGLDIVRSLTDDWGVRDIGKRRVVWARFGWSAGLRCPDMPACTPGGRIHAAVAAGRAAGSVWSWADRPRSTALRP